MKSFHPVLLCFAISAAVAADAANAPGKPSPAANAGKAANSESPELAGLRDKAEHGNAIAQYNLGLAYAQGRKQGQSARDTSRALWS